VVCDNEFAIFTANKEKPGMTLTYTGITHCYPGAFPVSINTSDRYLYIACWSDDSVGQGLLHDITVNGAPVFSDSPRWKVTYTNSNQSSCLGAPVTLTGTMIATILAPPGGWVSPSIGCANPTVGNNCYGIWGHWPTVSLSTHWTWYDSGNQIAPDAPFFPGFNHNEFLIFRLDMRRFGARLRDVIVPVPIVVDDGEDDHTTQAGTDPASFFVLAGAARAFDAAGPVSIDPRTLLGVFPAGTPLQIPDDPTLIGRTIYGQSVTIDVSSAGTRFDLAPPFEIYVE